MVEPYTVTQPVLILPYLQLPLDLLPALYCAVPNPRFILKYWLPILVVMGLIFFGSSDQSSARHSSRFFGPLVRLLFPSWSEPHVDRAIFMLRKVAHVTEYAILALLVWRALPARETENGRSETWRPAVWAFTVAVLYAITDEFHQAFVPTRQGCVTDVLIDAGGALLGLIFLWFLRRCRQKWRDRAIS